MHVDERDTGFAEAERTWLEYQALVNNISNADLERPMTVGTWSGRDVVTHIANWEEHCLGLIVRWDAGEPQTWIDEFDINDAAQWDIWNEAYVDRFRSKTIAEVREYASCTHDELMRVARASSVVTATNLRAMTSGHYEVHYEDLLALTKGS